jgi:heptosyltransferase-2
LASRICRKFRRPTQEGQKGAILVVRLDGLGDCILTLPLLDELRLRFPSAHISLLTSPAAAALLEGHPSIDEVLLHQPVRSRFLPGVARALLAAVRCYWSSLRGRKFDIAVSPRWDADVYMTTFLCAMTRAPLTAGFADATTPYKAWVNQGFERTWNRCVASAPLQHEVLHHLSLARALGCDVSPTRVPRLPVSSVQHQRAAEWIGERRDKVLVAVGLPAAEAKRRWNAEGYIAVLRRMQEQMQAYPILLADDETARAATKIREALPWARIALHLPLPQVAAILEMCQLFIGSDSGLGHLAAAVGCSTLTLSPHPLAGDPAHPNSPLRFRPYSDKAVVLQPQAPRGPCDASCVGRAPHCILEITPEQVLAAAEGLLSSGAFDRGLHGRDSDVRSGRD